MLFSRGAFSEVHHARHIADNKEYAIKCIKKKELEGREDALENEIDMLKRCVVSVTIHCRGGGGGYKLKSQDQSLCNRFSFKTFYLRNKGWEGVKVYIF